MNKEFSIGFTGDLAFSGYFAGQYHNQNLLDSDIRQFLNANDANIINFESPITSCRQTKKRRLSHRSDPEVLDFIKDQIQNPILSLANNHMMDFRSIGIIDSVENVEEAGIPFIGAGRSMDEASKCLILGNDLIKIGVIAIQYKEFRIKAEGRYAGPFCEKHDQFLKKRLDQIRPKVDWIVLVYHGGDEFLYAPMPYIRKQLKKYLSWGVDIIVGHHPHVVQGYEYFGKKVVFYSLGNFIFDTDYQRSQEGTDRGMLLRLTFRQDGFSFDNLPILIDRQNTVIRKGADDRHFCDVSSIGYSPLWKLEAYRKKEIRHRADNLKDYEISARKEKAIDDYIRMLQLKKAVELQDLQERRDLEDSILDDDPGSDGDYEIPDRIDSNEESQSNLPEEAELNPEEEAALRRELQALIEKYNLNYASEIDTIIRQEEAAKTENAPPPKPVVKKTTPRRALRRFYRKTIVNRRSNYRSFVVKFGAKWAQIFLKNKNLWK